MTRREPKTQTLAEQEDYWTPCPERTWKLLQINGVRTAYNVVVDIVDPPETDDRVLYWHGEDRDEAIAQFADQVGVTTGEVEQIISEPTQ